MAKRRSALREHVLVFEMGFEPTSLALVSSRAQTSKRSLYAHFESKEKLFLAVVELVRGLLLSRLRASQDHSGKPSEALTGLCGRYL
jgi:AcrR family transcriptional regulator